MFYRKITAFILIAAVVLCCISTNAAGEITAKDIPETSAESAILICADNGRVLYEKAADKQLAIASITKIMTGLIALEYAQRNDKVITFESSMQAEGSSLYLKVGEKLKVTELVKGLLCVSGNDAANALAIGIAGSTEAFAEIMNKKAARLGMTNTHFVTPSGLDDKEHYSSARDMALLCIYAMNNKSFADIVSQKNLEVSYEYPENKKQQCTNHNRLLSEYQGCIGIKTGYTSKAGRTLTSCAERDGIRLVAVTLNDRDDWNDHKKLFDFGFSQCTRVKAVSREQRFVLPIVGGKTDITAVMPENDALYTTVRTDENILSYKLYMPHFVYAPLKKGEKTGELRCYLDGKKIFSVPLIAAETVEIQEER